MTVEPPAADDLFGESITEDSGNYDREFWVEHAHVMHGISNDVLETKPTGWIVARVTETDNRYYD